MKNKKFKNPIVIIANGKYPSHPYPNELIKNAETIICTDGSANKLKNHGYDPTFVIGDMDSISNIKDFNKSEFLHIPRQDNTDLEKTFDFCIDSLAKEITVLGATGIRDDLAITNMLLLMKYHKKLKIKIVTDIYTVECIKGKNTFNSFPNQNISLIAVYRVKSVTTKGLKYSLTKQSLSLSGQGVSNTATGNNFTIRSSNRMLLFRGH